MSPIMRSKVQSMESMPHFPLSKTKLSVVFDKNHGIILELLINSAEIYLVREELSQNKENHVSSSEQKFRKGSNGNRLKAPYQDRQDGIGCIPQKTIERPFHYKDPKESLFYKESMVKVKKITRLRKKERQAKTSTENNKGKEEEIKCKMGREIDKTGHATSSKSKKRCKAQALLSLAQIKLS